MTWEPYNLDREAQGLVLKYRDKEGVISESHKMRTTVAYGLERFWGEHLRLISKKDQKDQNKGEYWKDTWKKFVKIMGEAGIEIPKGDVAFKETAKIQEVADKFWKLSLEDQRIGLTVLTQLCDSLVWWTQRYKKSGNGDENA